MTTQPNKIKQHFKDHKEAYIVGGVCLATGVVIGAVTILVVKKGGNQTTVAEMTNIVAWKPKQTIDVYVEALGDPGNVVQDLTTGTVYASQGQAARALGAYPSDMSKHLAGKKPHINGHIFEKLGKAIVSEAS